MRDEILKDVVGLFQIENMAPSQAATVQVCLSMNLLSHVNSEITVGNQISKSSQRGRKKYGKERAIIMYNPNSNPNISNPEIRVSKDHIEVFEGMERSAAILEKDDKAAEENQIFAKTINCFSYEEWKVICSVVEGVRREEVPRLEYKGTNKGKSKKGLWELRNLESSVNYDGKDEKSRGSKSCL